MLNIDASGGHQGPRGLENGINDTFEGLDSVKTVY